MCAFLKKHPFAVEAFFDYSLVLSYAVPKDELEPLLPPCLRLDTFNDKYGFVAVAMVQTKQLRPKGWPKFLGNNFFLIGYRIFVRYEDKEGRRLRGLYILKSETDKKQMALLGGIFTAYKYCLINVGRSANEEEINISSPQSQFHVSASINDQQVTLPEESPFSSWKEARRFAGPLPFTFSYNEQEAEVLIVEGVRQNWQPRPVSVLSSNIPFLAELGLKMPALANAFVIKDIPYYWKRGRVEKWKS